jgi:hypothetical protein
MSVLVVLVDARLLPFVQRFRVVPLKMAETRHGLPKARSDVVPPS